MMTDELMQISIGALRQQGEKFSMLKKGFDESLPLIQRAGNDKLLHEWVQTNEYANAVKNSISYINAAVDSANNAVGNAVGEEGRNAVINQIKKTAPKLPDAYMIACFAAMNFANDKMSSVIRRAHNPGLGEISLPFGGALAVGVGAAAYFFGPKIVDYFRKSL